ncbi:MAG: N-acetylmuramoyl-L-alanine amidase [Bacteroidales bacterium]|nr:N-acetylmuramoyl-L-alanine amidase [Bacteroidales bacterium]
MTIFLKQIKYQIVIFLLIIIKLILFSDAYAQETKQYKLKTVVIDAGHGGKDSGTRGRYTLEKNVALAIALKLGTYIEENIPDVKVIYTRTTDTLISFDERTGIANRNNADLFISIHLNGVKNNPKVYGTETFVMGLHKTQSNFELAKKENSAILFEDDYTTKYEGFDPQSAESYIIFSFLQNTHLEQSLNYAAFVEDEFASRALRKSRGVKQAGFLVLWKTTMPSVLIEAGFLSNPREEKFLKSKKGQEYIASAIYRAFKRYKNNIEEKSHFIAKVDSSVEKTSNTIFYKVQIASSKKPINTSKLFKGFKDIIEIKYNNIYKYAVGSFTNYSEVLNYKKTLEKKFPDAFIIATKNGNLIPLNKALRINKN